MGLTIEDYCLDFANKKFTRVILLRNTDSSKGIESNDIDWAEPFYEHQVQKSVGLKDFFLYKLSEEN